MGIGSILATAIRGVAWGQVANAAIQYGPEIVKKIRARRQPEAPTVAAEDTEAIVEQLKERVEELEAALVSQQELIIQQTKAITTLEDAARTLQTRLRTATLLAAGLGLTSLILLIWALSK